LLAQALNETREEKSRPKKGGIGHWGRLQVEPPDGSACGEGRDGLHREYAQGLCWSPREPFHHEVCDYRHLSGHEQLPEMSRGSFVGFTGGSEYRNVTEH